ncbi:MAG: hypothetical protein AAF490_07545 [Chloroflexota bacterium]
MSIKFDRIRFEVLSVVQIRGETFANVQMITGKVSQSAIFTTESGNGKWKVGIGGFIKPKIYIVGREVLHISKLPNSELEVEEGMILVSVE